MMGKIYRTKVERKNMRIRVMLVSVVCLFAVGIQAQADPTLDALVADVHAASMARRTNVLSDAIGVETLWPSGVWGDNMWALSLLFLNERRRCS